jgi:hypothetical protein
MTVKPAQLASELQSGDKLAGDLIQGASAIATHIFGNPAYRRRVYHLAETGKLPVFRLGAAICARKSTIEAWIGEQEKTSKPGPIQREE